MAVHVRPVIYERAQRRVDGCDVRYRLSLLIIYLLDITINNSVNSDAVLCQNSTGSFLAVSLASSYGSCAPERGRSRHFGGGGPRQRGVSACRHPTIDRARTHRTMIGGDRHEAVQRARASQHFCRAFARLVAASPARGFESQYEGSFLRENGVRAVERGLWWEALARCWAAVLSSLTYVLLNPCADVALDPLTTGRLPRLQP